MRRVLVIEDHPVMSNGTCQMLRKYLPDAECTEADTFWKAIQAADSIEFDLVVMDIGVPGGNSVQMVEKFRTRWPSVVILMFTSYEENLYALPCIKAGANGFISKRATESEFRVAVETVLFRHRVYLSDTIRDLSLDMYIRPQRSQANVLDTLSRRENEILQMFLARKGVSEIGAVLNLSTSTINTYRYVFSRSWALIT
jgi:two-component system invasion response regulator UvrY